MATKTHNSTSTAAHANSHGSPTFGTHRPPSAGSLRPRGSSKRNQIPKARKNQLETNDSFKAEEQTPASGSAVEKRLAAAVRSKRLDFSLPRQNLAPSEPPAFQIFPTVVVDHVKQGHILTELWLTNHHVGSLPAEIAVFTKLRVLGLAGNALTTLPAELCQLTALEALYLEKNRFQTLPTKVAFPPQLRELRLDNNQLSVFPAQLTKLRLLNRLGLSNNQLKTLPEEIHRLRNLVELNLDYNRLDADFPDGFAALQRLERLGLEGNFLAERPVILDRLPVLSCPAQEGGLPQFGGTAALPRPESFEYDGTLKSRVSQTDKLYPRVSGPGISIYIFIFRFTASRARNLVMAGYESMPPSPSSSFPAQQQSKDQLGGDSKVDTTVDIPGEDGLATPRSFWRRLITNYRALEFGCTLCLYPVAYVFASIDVYDRQIPGIRVRLNSTAEVWSLDPTINEKKLAQEVPMWLLLVLGICLPVGTNLVVNYALPAFCQVRVIAHDTRDFLLSLFQSVALAIFMTQFIKNITGRFRPCFYDMCKWNHDVVWDGITNLCTYTAGEKEGRKSFPSGHASFAWSTMLVLTLYLLGRSRLNCANNISMLRGGQKTLAMFLCCLPLLLAVWVCVTRSIDNWHHYSDILAGSVIGVAAAIFAVANHYGSIFSWEFAGLPHETIHERLQRSET
ncbi:hypothetical protein ON010_g1167 [Phytophthora cinnamomi]|nr:hypothetical protein ON010_g1167 [Phytophthora cinnamomi]